MKPMISSIGALGATLIFLVPSANALSCSQHAAQLQERQADTKALADARLTLVDDVEAAGDAWENAEALRNFSAEQATEADLTKTEYESLKADLLQKETSLQTAVIALNDEVAAYNTRCVRN